MPNEVEDDITIETALDKLYDIKEAIREHSAMLTEMKNKAKDLEDEIILRMDDLGLSKAGTERCNFSLRSDVVPMVDIEKWDEIRLWALQNGYGALLQRKLNTAPYKELIEMGIEIPYVKPHTVIKTSLTKVRNK